MGGKRESMDIFHSCHREPNAMMMMTTAVSRVSAAQPGAFWLACERGSATLFVHDSARQEKRLAL
jgi:hypothetical protein